MSEFSRTSGNFIPQSVRTLIAAGILLTACSNQGPAQPGEQSPVTQANEVEQTIEDARELQQAATIQLRSSLFVTGEKSKGGMPADWDQRATDINTTAANCTATHVGNGWFATASHCFDSQLHVGGSFYGQTYDAVANGDIRNKFSAWNGQDPETMTKIGDVDSVIINGDISVGDMAMVHVSGLNEFPKMSITAEDNPSRAFNRDDEYYIAGYPQSNNYRKIQAKLTYLGLTSANYFQDSHGLTNNNPMPVFGVPKTSSQELLTICTPGMSGSTVTNDDGEVLGVLSRYDVEGGNIWTTLGRDLSEYSTICTFQPFTSNIVRDIESMRGVLPSSDVRTGGK
ncbi:MAG: hypothetical protein QG628_620 [Patescibacteria group bacterium]|jgi:V8-like Glu-specific endopeptidase|nr:hypothetical protein [Patescibacteria group bacterium]